jgi:hypothetical protein
MSIARVHAALTGAFVGVTLVAAWGFAPWQRSLVTAVDLGLFVGGTAAFLWSFAVAVGRSRTEEISVAALYLLGGGIVPRRLALAMHACLALQVVVGLGAAIARSSTDGRPGSALAFGVLVPVLGVGLNGVLAVRHGTFGLRDTGRGDGGSAIGKNDDRG